MSPLVVLEKGKRATGVVPRLSPSNTRDRPTASSNRYERRASTSAYRTTQRRCGRHLC